MNLRQKSKIYLFTYSSIGENCTMSSYIRFISTFFFADRNCLRDRNKNFFFLSWKVFCVILPCSVIKNLILSKLYAISKNVEKDAKNVWSGAENVRHGAKNVWHGAKKMRHGAKNMRHGDKSVRHGAKNVRPNTTKIPHPPILGWFS